SHPFSSSDPPTSALHTLPLHDALPICAFVYSLVEDPAGHLWAGTNRGLVRFDPLAARPSFRAYAPADGLQSPEFNAGAALRAAEDRKSTRLNSSHVKISYAVFCLKKKR